MNRRDFIKGSFAATGLLAANGLSLAASSSVESGAMPMNTLGRTGVKVSRLAYGCAPLGWDSQTQDDVDKILSKAVDLGINYFDTAPNYGKSEERMGNIMPSIRKKIFLVSKTEAHDYDGTWRLLERSMKRMNTDYIDMVHIHNFGYQKRFEDSDFVLSDKGTLGALEEAKQQGVIRFIGASGHVYPSRFHKALDTGKIDVLMNAVNYIVQHIYNFEDKVWSRARMNNLGLVAMKVFGGAVRRNNSRISAENRDMALRYVYSLPGLSTAVIGMKSKEELIQNVNAAKKAKPLSEKEMYELSKKGHAQAQTDEWKAIHGTPVL
jgi:aryl-alcohol dehydrogenase-like predicted oxidoreductase